MAKLKLKSVQNGTGIENPNLLDNGAPNYVNDQGVVFFGSGILDNSGNVVDQGWIEIQGGSGYWELGNDPAIIVEYTWGSGNFDLPIPITSGPNGCNTCVSMNITDIRFGGSPNWEIDEVSDAIITGITPLTVRWDFGYMRYRKELNVVYTDHPIMGSETGTFTFPFIYHEPVSEEEEDE